MSGESSQQGKTALLHEVNGMPERITYMYVRVYVGRCWTVDGR